jgi:uncharacterized membrane protein
MNVKKVLIVQALLALTGILYNLYMWQVLPEKVPMHWNMQGEIDRWGSKAELMSIGWVMVGLPLLLTVIIVALSPKGYEATGKEAGPASSQGFAVTMIGVSALLIMVDVLILRAAQKVDMKSDIGGWILAGVFVFFAVIGNGMGQIRRNFYMGVRTPWTLANEETWRLTHRAAGRLWFFGGIAGAILSLLPVHVGIAIVWLLVMSFWPVIDSYLIYRRVTHTGDAI